MTSYFHLKSLCWDAVTGRWVIMKRSVCKMLFQLHVSQKVLMLCWHFLMDSPQVDIDFTSMAWTFERLTRSKVRTSKGSGSVLRTVNVTMSYVHDVTIGRLLVIVLRPITRWHDIDFLYSTVLSAGWASIIRLFLRHRTCERTSHRRGRLDGACSSHWGTRIFVLPNLVHVRYNTFALACRNICWWLACRIVFHNVPRV